MGISDADRTADDTSSLRSAPVAEAEQLGSVQRRLAAALLLLSAVLVVNPIVAFALLRSGSEWLAMAASTKGTPLIVAAGVLQLSAAAVVITLLLASWGCLRGLRWGARLGWVGLGAAAVVLVGPLSRVSVTSWLPLGTAAGLALLAITAWVLRPVATNGQHRDRVGARVVVLVLGGFAIVVVGLALWHVGPRGGGLPGAPIWLSGADYREGPGTPEPFTATEQPQNLAMAQFPFAGIHNDAAQTDLYPQALAIDPATAQLRTFFAGGGCASLAWDSAGNVAAVCVSDSVTAYVLNGRDLSELARYRLSDRPLTPDFLTDFGGGGYMYLDADDAIVTPTLDGSVVVLAQIRDDSGTITLRPSAEYDLTGVLLDGEIPTSALPDSTGRIWFVGQRGTVGYIEPAAGAVTGRQWPGEDIENSFATGAQDDVYVVTSKALRRLSAGPQGPEVVWASDYDVGIRRKPGQTSRASGTTPTLHGTDWVSIADNGETTHVDVFRRSDGARVCHTPVFASGVGATENTLVAIGDDLLVENNYGYALFDVLGGHSTEAGLVRINVDDTGNCAIGWRNDDLSIPSVVSKASAAGGIALTYAKEPTWWGADRWWITAVGLRDGRVAWQRQAGVGSARNNHYAAIYMSPQGDVVVGTVMGIVAMIPAE